MPGMLTVNGFLRRHSRVVSVIGLLLVLGVAALDAHAALPEHHDHDGVATVCVAALAIATLMMFGWRIPRLLRAPGRTPVRMPRLVADVAAALPPAMARAGPPGWVPIRC